MWVSKKGSYIRLGKQIQEIHKGDQNDDAQTVRFKYRPISGLGWKLNLRKRRSRRRLKLKLRLRLRVGGLKWLWSQLAKIMKQSRVEFAQFLARNQGFMQLGPFVAEHDLEKYYPFYSV